MKAVFTSAALAALVALANAKATFTNNEINPQPGKPFTLTWSGASGPVSILLKTGPEKQLVTVKELKTGITDDSVDVTLNAKDFASGTYAFEIIDGSGDPNYSAKFDFVGTGTNPSETGTKGTASPTTAASTATNASASKSASPTTSGTRSPATNTPTSTPDVPGQAPSRLASPLALIFVSVAAMFYFN